MSFFFCDGNTSDKQVWVTANFSRTRCWDCWIEFGGESGVSCVEITWVSLCISVCACLTRLNLKEKNQKPHPRRLLILGRITWQCIIHRLRISVNIWPLKKCFQVMRHVHFFSGNGFPQFMRYLLELFPVSWLKVTSKTTSFIRHCTSPLQ